MKKLLFQACLLVGSAMMFGVSVNAQYRAQIPFDFEAGKVHYAAGEYVLGPLNSSSSASSLAIRDVATGRTRLAGITTLSGDGWKGVSKLVFVKTGDSYSLSEIVTSRFTYKGRPSKRYSRVGNVAAAVDTVTVNLD